MNHPTMREESFYGWFITVPSMGGVEWSEPLLHSTPYQLEWSGVE
jgi:hypothetical protein